MDILTPETLIPLSAVGSVLLVAVGGARAYEAIRTKQNTQGEDHAAEVAARKEAIDAERSARKEALETERRAREKLEDEMKQAKEQSFRRHEDHAQRIGELSSRQLQTDTRVGGLEQHLVNQDAKLDRMDQNIMKILMQGTGRRKDDAA